ncbi:BQ5605_C064g12777 [Microbotryum silenes-dioicae]|uniref:BQ5605_C064g12777 protein n=1 Tax=Microbotryum silenes-dioicae TaxID=796604 RepID=A0A2X0PPS0_9BASI|nr:BQ5605_C064g12777 [Microbotryum silenes-dioicae]
MSSTSTISASTSATRVFPRFQAAIARRASAAVYATPPPPITRSAKTINLNAGTRARFFRADQEERRLDSRGQVQADEEKSARCKVIDEAAALALTLPRRQLRARSSEPFYSPRAPPDAPSPSEPLTITLNDALPSSLDPTSVGLQSWGSSILLARMIALNPTSFGIARGENERTLELGAGTGLLSLVWKGMSERLDVVGEEVIATDYHEAVLENLRRWVTGMIGLLKNCLTSFSSILASGTLPPTPPPSALQVPSQLPPRSTLGLAPRVPLLAPTPNLLSNVPVVTAYKLDWSAHALWLKSCVQQFLIQPNQYTPKPRKRRVVQTPTPFSLDSVKDALVGVELDSVRTTVPTPTTSDAQSSFTSVPSPAFHLIPPPSHTHIPDDPYRVAIKRMTELHRVKGIGRADEESYRLYEIGWC